MASCDAMVREARLSVQHTGKPHVVLQRRDIPSMYDVMTLSNWRECELRYGRRMYVLVAIAHGATNVETLI